MIKSMLLHTSAWAVNGDVFLNPPQSNDEDPNCLFELDLVFTKAISINEGEQIIKTLPIRMKSVFRNAELKEPNIELKEHVVSTN